MQTLKKLLEKGEKIIIGEPSSCRGFEITEQRHLFRTKDINEAEHKRLCRYLWNGYKDESDWEEIIFESYINRESIIIVAT